MVETETETETEIEMARQYDLWLGKLKRDAKKFQSNQNLYNILQEAIIELDSVIDPARKRQLLQLALFPLLFLVSTKNPTVDQINEYLNSIAQIPTANNPEIDRIVKIAQGIGFAFSILGILVMVSSVAAALLILPGVGPMAAAMVTALVIGAAITYLGIRLAEIKKPAQTPSLEMVPAQRALYGISDFFKHKLSLETANTQPQAESAEENQPLGAHGL